MLKIKYMILILILFSSPLILYFCHMGNISNSIDKTDYVENPIEISIVSPANGVTLFSDFNIKGIASSPNGIKTIETYIDQNFLSGSNWSDIGSKNRFEDTRMFSPKTFSVGNHWVSVKVIDNAGFEKLATNLFKIENPLDIKFLNPLNETMIVPSEGLNISGYISGLYSNHSIKVWFDSETMPLSAVDATLTAPQTIYSDKWTWTCSLSPSSINLSEGNHILYAEVIDTLGNTKVDSITLYISDGNVGISILYPANNTSHKGIVTIKGLAVASPASGSGFDGILEVSVDSKKLIVNVTNSWTAEWDTSKFDIGNHVIRAIVTRTADLTKSETQILVSLNDIDIKITNPLDGSSWTPIRTTIIRGNYISGQDVDTIQVRVGSSGPYSGAVISSDTTWFISAGELNLFGNCSYGYNLLQARIIDKMGNEAKDEVVVNICQVKICGLVRDASTGAPISNAGVSLLDPVTLNPVLTINTSLSTSGTNFCTPLMCVGSYILQFTASGYSIIREAYSFDICQTMMLGCTLLNANNLSSGDMRFTICWDQTPSDLDLHAVFPDPNNYYALGGRGHVWYSYKGTLSVSPYVNLEADDTTSWGPETIIVKAACFNSAGNGNIKIRVHDFTNRNSTTSTQMKLLSGARCMTYDSNGYIPPSIDIQNATGGPQGNGWKILTVDKSTRAITIENSIYNVTSSVSGGDYVDFDN